MKFLCKVIVLIENMASRLSKCVDYQQGFCHLDSIYINLAIDFENVVKRVFLLSTIER